MLYTPVCSIYLYWFTVCCVSINVKVVTQGLVCLLHFLLPT